MTRVSTDGKSLPRSGPVVVIGVDGLDRDLVTRYRQAMPNLSRLIDEGVQLPMRSVLPPDSNTAWATIYTGQNPAQHGFVHFVDPLNRIQLISSKEVGAGVVEGKAFWDVASAAGKRVCLVLPHLGFPVWNVNGVMVARSTMTSDVQCHPPGALDPEQLSRLDGVKGFPGSRRQISSYLDRMRRVMEAEIEVGTALLRREPWDLFFWYTPGLDAVMHFFWRYADEADPSWPGHTSFSRVIEEFHSLADRAVGALMDAAPPDATFMVLSDHGHGMRPVRLLNVNEILHREGLFVKRGESLPEESGPTSRRGRNVVARAAVKGGLATLDRSKRLALALAGRYQLGRTASRVLRWFPAIRRLFTAPAEVDFERTRAYATDLSGIKAYSYGGVVVRKDLMSPSEYEDVRGRIVEAISAVRDPETNEAVAETVCRREDLYSGPHLDLYPDIVFNLRHGYGAGWEARGRLFGEGFGHSLVPGSHRIDSAVLVLNPGHIDRDEDAVGLEAIAPTILGALGVPTPEGMAPGLKWSPWKEPNATADQYASGGAGS